MKKLFPPLRHALPMLLLAVTAFVGAVARQPPPGFDISLSPLSAHFFTTLSDVFQFIGELDCRKDGGVK
jgi:hypothetical protein